MRYLTIALMVVIAAPLSAQPTPTYAITHTYTIGAERFWDYIVPDPANHRLFIARQTRVMVIDANDGAAGRSL
jgi:hypothetical protein